MDVPDATEECIYECALAELLAEGMTAAGAPPEHTSTTFNFIRAFKKSLKSTFTAA